MARIASDEEVLTSRMSEIFEIIDKSYLRQIQKKSFKCSAACCEDGNKSLRDIDMCIKKCEVPFKNAETSIYLDYWSTERKFKTCKNQCQAEYDEAQKTVAKDSNQIFRLQDTKDACIVNCLGEFRKLLPALEKKMRDVTGSSKSK